MTKRIKAFVSGRAIFGKDLQSTVDKLAQDLKAYRGVK